jgi:hypothetical protein
MTDGLEKLSNDVDELARRVAALPREFGWRELLPVISVVATLALVIYSANLDSRTRANERDIELARQKNEHDIELAKQKLEDSAFRIAVLHEVKDAIAERDQRRQEAVAQFVQSLEATQFQISMANILAHLADSPEAKAIGGYTALEANLNLESREPSTEVISSSPRGWNYDVFWCEYPTKDENEKMAQLVADELNQKKETEHLGRIRPRPLPAAINDAPGYKIQGYVILRHISKEAQAKQLLDWLNTAPNRPKIVIRDSDRRLPGYLSAFVCPNALN